MRSSCLALSVAVVGLALSAHAGEPEQPPPESSGVLRVELQALTSDVWGGDGDNLPAVWELIMGLAIHNDGDQPVVLLDAPWVLDLDSERLEGRYKGNPIEIPAGASTHIMFSRYLSLERLDLLREGVRTPAERSVRRINGQVDFAEGAEARYTPFTVDGRYRDCMDHDT